MLNMQSTFLLKLTVRLIYRFLLFHFEGPLRRVLLHIVIFDYIVGICSGKKIALYTFDSAYPDTSLNWHYLKKQNQSRPINEVRLYFILSF